MRRRQFMALVGSAAAWPVVASAQQATRRVGILMPESVEAGTGRVAAFRTSLQGYGWTEGRDVEFFIHYASGRPEKAASLVAELGHAKVHAIVTAGTELIAASKKLSSKIPVVMAGIGDPVGSGIVANLARPGGHVTGLSLMHPDLAAKRLELAKEALSELRRIAMIWNPRNASVGLRFKETAAAAPTLGIVLESVQVKHPSDFEKGIATAAQAGAQALITTEDALLLGHRSQIVSLAVQHRLPPISGLRQFVDAGGLLSYGPNSIDLWRRAAGYVDKIFRGANPAELPVEQPTRFELIINLKTAKGLGLNISPTLLSRADEVIE